MIRLLTHYDIAAWLKLAKEVEHLFGPMTDSEDFKNGIKQCIENKNAYGMENSDGVLAGIIAIDRERNEILWLAVGQQFRGNNYGDRLIKKAIDLMQSNGNIFVRTFAENMDEGKAARSIYEKNGFKFLKGAGKNPANIETVIMIKQV
jgi:ribosomal protein S18 acetylase RimI-like enzyme